MWSLPNQQGSIRDPVDNGGVLINHVVFESFGNITGHTNPTQGFHLGYTGREFDAETGLYFYRARYYDTAAGGFVSEDPIGFDPDENFFVTSGTTRLIAPMRRDCKEVVISVTIPS